MINLQCRFPREACFLEQPCHRRLGYLHRSCTRAECRQIDTRCGPRRWPLSQGCHTTPLRTVEEAKRPEQTSVAWRRRAVEGKAIVQIPKPSDGALGSGGVQAGAPCRPRRGVQSPLDDRLPPGHSQIIMEFSGGDKVPLTSVPEGVTGPTKGKLVRYRRYFIAACC